MKPSIAGCAGVILGLHLAASPGLAQDLTAGVVLEKMDNDQRFTYMAGVVEGLAYARFRSDQKEMDGMNCIYRWFYDDATTAVMITDAFERFPDHLPGAVIGALVKRSCGE